MKKTYCDACHVEIKAANPRILNIHSDYVKDESLLNSNMELCNSCFRTYVQMLKSTFDELSKKWRIAE